MRGGLARINFICTTKETRKKNNFIFRDWENGKKHFHFKDDFDYHISIIYFYMFLQNRGRLRLSLFTEHLWTNNNFKRIIQMNGDQ